MQIKTQDGKRAWQRRTALAEVRIGAVELQPPKDHAAAGSVELWLVQVRETSTPPAAGAERIASWYGARWVIEEYSRLLKTGTRIGDRRLQEAVALVKCLAFDAITAWRVFALDRYARDAPATPVGEGLSEDEQEVIEQVVRKGRLLPPAERGQLRPEGIRSCRRQRLVLGHPADRNPGLGPAARHPRPAPRTRARRCRARPARRGPQAGPRQSHAGPPGRRPPLGEAPGPRCSGLRRGRPTRARAEGQGLVPPVARAELVTQHGAVRLPAHRQPARVRG